jgi:epoxyqueuosine reductase QueG
MGNQRGDRFRQPLEKMAQSPDALVAEHARWALTQLQSN